MLLLLCSTVFCSADILKLQATHLAYKYQNDYGYWSDWTEWESTSVLIVINTDTERVNIYSAEPQEYDIYDAGNEEYDSDGGTTTKFQCIDKSGLRCTMRIREQSNGQLQLYIDYSDFMFVYNVYVK